MFCNFVNFEYKIDIIMKKVITISLLVITLLVGGMTVDAKTTKKSSKTKTSQNTKISSPAGHTYKCKFSDFSFKLVFNTDNTGYILREYGEDYGGQTERENFTWSCDSNKIKCSLFPNGLKMSSNGKTLTVIDKNNPNYEVYKLVK